MSLPHLKNLLLTGRPGIGKTTVIMHLAERLQDRTVAGFYTEEIRQNERRQGFRIVTFCGREATLAHVSFRGPPRVGRYGVDVGALEDLAIPELGRAGELMLIDEVGTMECFSTRFVAAVRGLLDGAMPVVATVAARGAGFIAEVRAREDAEILEVNQANRDRLPQLLVERLRLAR